MSARHRAYRPPRPCSTGEEKKFDDLARGQQIPASLLEYRDAATGAHLAWGIVYFTSTGDPDSDMRGCYRERIRVLERDTMRDLGTPQK